ncbi:ornithine cyclodeaminase [Streptomyces agglomeratus]|uniref:Ornithine cyclodeaminase n=1 Tax=Streptomyces agglomeratus TaxID=285458 RepID=A0A1E5P4D6_9ACTN|nr:ornithine cyclodeaminase [Streptomyces agglomeratus]OEJ24403.1 ornithine cyclodeaminase [Streptomyces agglomeratus]OEJ41645.1 ornithine cyclodeaminase [Streptomyces agglomeratus]OEJ43976.1 ornithine cyclodeaminase [Streptomyces agglomeratus]OEJ54136.1 ornithine cyclodeaminase [Streptomyces agglomeratus]OEJ61508.1 ornithine cyclodeaminase [Streptomyces agglomeratus]
MDLGSLPRIDAGTLDRLMPMRHAVTALVDALRAGVLTGGDAMPRTVTGVSSGQLLYMPAEFGPYAGVKLASVAPGNADLDLPRISGLYVLLDSATLLPLALLDGAALTSLRTPAVSALAVDRLAVPGAARLVVFGTGPQAWRHVEAMRTVRPVGHVGVVGRDPGRTEAFLTRCRDAGLPADRVGNDAVRDADLVLCCTTAREPLFPGRLVPAHATVVAVGSHEPDAREVDTDLVCGSTLVVESRSTALREAGDILLPLAEGKLRPDAIAGDLAELVGGRVDTGRPVPRLFKSVGMAWQDLAVAAAAYERLRAAPDRAAARSG